MRIGKKIFLSSAIFTSSLIFSCVGGGGGGGTTTTTTTNTNGTGITAQFIDAPVQGLDYETSSGLSGVTDANGNFNYNLGDTVTFKIGDIVVGTVQIPVMEKYVTPTDLVTDNSPNGVDLNKVRQIVAFLIALDKDKNPDNGIQIDENLKNKLKGANVRLDEEDVMAGSVNIDINDDGVLEDLYEDLIKLYEEQAKTHYTGTLTTLLLQALELMQNQPIYIENRPNEICSITNIDTTNLSFVVECKDANGNVLGTETYTINVDTNTGYVYIVDENGNQNLLTEIEDDEVCYVTPDYTEVCLTTEMEDMDS